MTTQTEKDDPTILGSDGRRVIAWAYPASPHSIDKVLQASLGDDGRSEFKWLRLENGDLMLGVFPRGATYEDLEVEAALPANARGDDDLRAANPVRHERRLGFDYLVDEGGVSVSFFRMPNGQLYVGINTEDAPKDNSQNGEPYVQVELNDASLYDNEPPRRHRDLGPGGPYILRCVFTPQRGEGDSIFAVPLSMLGRDEGEAVWIGEYDEAPSEQRSYQTDALREHPECPEWIREWDGPFEIDFQVRFTVIGTFSDSIVNGDEQRYASHFWADDADHAVDQAIDETRTWDGELRVAAVVYGEPAVAA